MKLLISLVLGLLTSLAPTPRPVAPDPLSLTLLTFNIRYGTANDGPDTWPHRREMVAEVIAGRPYDAVCLQEALRSQLDDLASAPGLAEADFAEVGVGREDGRTGGEYSAILYNHSRFTSAQSGTFWLSETPENPGSRSWNAANVRICTWVRLVEKSTGRGVYIYNTHWDHISQEAREKSADLITARIAARDFPDPVILAGDFNAAEDNPAIATLKGPAATPRLVDTFRVLHPDETDIQTFNGFKPREEWGRGKIDSILAQPGVEVSEAWIDRREKDGRYPSDHFPVGAQVKVSAPR
jgi:endonuclease/exonuclease/phosphatase family metal-dependent hydrolase